MKNPAKKRAPATGHEALILAAVTAKSRAYSPYSRFRVGAALKTKSGHVFAGCNVENRSYGLTICAERNAVAQAIAHGESELECIAIASDASPPAPPCGACREVLAEFARDLPIVLVGSNPGEIFEHRLADLLPERFVFEPPDRPKRSKK
ncbi:MAG: cytidine deaminase [Deltaproteobacteria bacterium]|nr:cytidine deaminase [Deltaproteobacteria bacterium]